MRYKLAKKITPRFVKVFIQRKIHEYLECVEGNKPKNCFCPVCRNNVLQFERLSDDHDEMAEKYGYIHSIHLAETLNRRAYGCPVCGASDRNRLYAMYI
jgi:rubredoxin